MRCGGQGGVAECGLVPEYRCWEVRWLVTGSRSFRFIAVGCQKARRGFSGRNRGARLLFVGKNYRSESSEISSGAELSRLLL